MEEEDYSPYCSVCSGCGEEGCCSPICCVQHEEGKYCKTYLNDLKFGYLMYEKIYNLVFNDEKYKNEIENIFSETYDKIYRK
jgi:hypothetical protein